MTMTLTPVPARPAVANPLTLLASELRRVETLNVCVQMSIAGVAALAGPAEFRQLIADGFDAAVGEEDLRALYPEVPEAVEADIP